MSDREAFLQAVMDRPDDDLPRLIYADWLDEHGESERAELIRVQCQLARGEGTAADREREASLLRSHGRKWVHPVAYAQSPPLWRRGFVEELTVAGPDFYLASQVWFAHPVQACVFLQPRLGDLFESFKLVRLRRLVIVSDVIDYDGCYLAATCW